MGKIRGAHNSPGIYTRAIDFGNIPSTRNNRKATLSIEERKGGGGSGGGGGHKEKVLAHGVADSSSSFVLFAGTYQIFKPASRSENEPYGFAFNGNFSGKDKQENCIKIGATGSMDSNCVLKLSAFQTAGSSKTLNMRVCYGSVTSSSDGEQISLSFTTGKSAWEGTKYIEEFEFNFPSTLTEPVDCIYIGPAGNSDKIGIVEYKITKP
jgi:hypothetical protein